MLSQLVTEYHEVQRQIKELEEEKKKLKAKIDLNLSAIGESKYEGTHYSAVMSQHQRVSYDTDGLLESIVDMGFTEADVCSKSIDLKKVEKLVSSGQLDALQVAKFAKVKNIKTLTVKENK